MLLLLLGVKCTISSNLNPILRYYVEELFISRNANVLNTTYNLGDSDRVNALHTVFFIKNLFIKNYPINDLLFVVI